MKLVLVSVVLATLACGGREITAPAAASITISDDACTADAIGNVVPDGFVVTLVNSTTDRAFFHLFLLNEGATYSQLVDHIKEEQRRIRSAEPQLGFPRFAILVSQRDLGPLENGSMEWNFVSGTYGMVCGRSGNAGTPGIHAVGPFKRP